MAKGSNLAVLAGAALALFASPPAEAEDPAAAAEIPEIEVIGIAPLQGTGVDPDQVPGNIHLVDPAALKPLNAYSLTDLLSERIDSATVVEAQNSPFQQTLLYRGFTASPQLGEPQGLAIYQNGVRVNEAFGDTMQWDLVPEAAIDQVDVVSTNPVFGLNALGGALAIRLKNGFDFAGAEAEAMGGYFERAGGSVQLGRAVGNVGAYLAAERHHDGGWRNDSPSDVARLYTDLGLLGERFSANLNLVLADTDLTGNGVVPEELLAENRRAQFTIPDVTENRLVFATANGSHDLSDTISVQGSLHFRKLIQRRLNGDETNAANCDLDAPTQAAVAGDPGLAAIGNGAAVAANPNGFICTEDDDPEFVLDQNGNAIAQFADHYGANNTSSTITNGWGASLQATDDDTLLGHDNLFVAGASFDWGLTRFHSESGLGEMILSDRSVRAQQFPFLNTGVYFADAGGGAVALGDVGPARAKAVNRYYGVYVSDTFSVNDEFAITLAGRYNRAEIELRDHLDSFVPRTSDLNGSHRFSRFNPAIGMTHKIAPLNATLYAGYSESNRAPSPAELSCADPDAPCSLPNAFVADPPLEQVVGRAVEVGLRGGLSDLPQDATLDWRLGAFWSKNDNDILFVSAGPGIGSGFFRNVGDTDRKGVELGLDGSWGPVSAFFSYSLVAATFGSSFTVNSPHHPAAVDDEILVELGDDIPGIPDHSIKLGADYGFLDGWSVGGTLIAASGVYLRGDEANLLEKTDPYAIVNLRGSYAWSESVELFVQIDNVFNTDYETFGALGAVADEVPIHELPEGIASPRFLGPGQPFGAFAGLRLRLN